MEPAQARAAVARKRVKRAEGLLREVGRELAALVDDADVFGTVRAHDEASRTDAKALIELGVERYGAVDVVVIARPQRRRNTPTMAPNGAEENSHASSITNQEAAQQRERQVIRR